VSLLGPNHPTRRVRRALGLKTILGSDYPGEPFPELPEELRRFLSDAKRPSSQAPKPDHPETDRAGNNPSAFTQKPLPETGIPIPVPPDPAGGLREELQVPLVKQSEIDPEADGSLLNAGMPRRPSGMMQRLSAAAGSPLLAHQRRAGKAPNETDFVKTASAGEPPSVTVPLPAEKIRKQIEKGEIAIGHLDRIIEHQQDQLERLVAREEHDPGFIDIPDWITRLFTKIGQILIFLSLVDRFDRAVTNPRTIAELRESIPRMIEVRGEFINKVSELHTQLGKLE
jgi:hypothetical protein